MERQFIVGSGFYHKPEDSMQAHWFFNLWLENTRQVCPYQDIYMLANGGCLPASLEPFNLIGVRGNLGHLHDLIGKSNTPKPHQYCGWSATVMALALIAYNDERDFIYKEADCLAFGPWVHALYKELGDAGMIFGKSKVMPCSQSLFLIRHWFITQFVAEYLGGFKSDRELLPESKFEAMLKYQLGHGLRSEVVRQFTFGYDRDRPINFDDPVFYFQKATPDELRECERRGLLTLPPNMPEVKAFTGDTTGL